MASLTALQGYQTSSEYCYPGAYNPQSPAKTSDWAFTPPALPTSPYMESPLSSVEAHDPSWNPFEQAFASAQTSKDTGAFMPSRDIVSNAYQASYGAQPYINLAAIKETTTFDDMVDDENPPRTYETSPFSCPSANYSSREPTWNPRRNSASSSTSKPAPASSKRRKSSDKESRSSHSHSRSKSDSEPRLRSTIQPSRATTFSSSSSSSARSPPSGENIRGRTNHNQVEKQYRNRLNGQFESLLNKLPNDDDRDGAKSRVSKAEVLMLAKRHIVQLEQEKTMLEEQRMELENGVEELKRRFVQMGGVCMP